MQRRTRGRRRGGKPETSNFLGASPLICGKVFAAGQSSPPRGKKPDPTGMGRGKFRKPSKAGVTGSGQAPGRSRYRGEKMAEGTGPSRHFNIIAGADQQSGRWHVPFSSPKLWQRSLQASGKKTGTNGNVAHHPPPNGSPRGVGHGWLPKNHVSFISLAARRASPFRQTRPLVGEPRSL